MLFLFLLLQCYFCPRSTKKYDLIYKLIKIEYTWWFFLQKTTNQWFFNIIDNSLKGQTIIICSMYSIYKLKSSCFRFMAICFLSSVIVFRYVQKWHFYKLLKSVLELLGY